MPLFLPSCRYCYKTLKNLLSEISPLGKFMCIKMVVFATFWQQTFFTILFWSKWGKDIQWCDPDECCMLPDGDGSAAYQERCDNKQQAANVLCGFCPQGSKADKNGNVILGADYHVLENNTMQATLVSALSYNRLLVATLTIQLLDIALYSVQLLGGVLACCKVAVQSCDFATRQCKQCDICDFVAQISQYRYCKPSWPICRG